VTGTRSRIAQLVPGAAMIGGTEFGTVRLIKAVQPHGFESIAFCVPEAEAESLFHKAGVRVVTYIPPTPSFRHCVGYFRASLALARQLREARIDLLHCADMLGAHYAALAGRLAGIPVLSHIRAVFDEISWRDCQFLKLVDRFVFVSEHSRRTFGCSIAPSRSYVIYDGIDKPSPHSRQDAAAVRREFQIESEAPIVGMVARMAPVKDYATLAKAAARVMRKHPTVRFLVIGDYKGTSTARAHFQTVQGFLRDNGVDGVFIFAGNRTDVSRLVSALDVFVLSTHLEGFPLVILEAMALGKPVIATAVGGIPEIVKHRETGLLFDRENDAQFADGLLEFLENPALRNRLAAAGEHLVRQSFTTAAFGRRMSEVYASMLRDRHRAQI